MKINLIETKEILDFEKEIGFELEVNEREDGMSDTLNPRRFYAFFKEGAVKEGAFLISVTGNGDTIDEALQDYANQISFTRMAFLSHTDSRKEVSCPKLVHTKTINNNTQIKNMSLIEKVKVALEQNEDYDFSSDFWTDDILVILHDTILETEQTIKGEIESKYKFNSIVNKWSAGIFNVHENTHSMSILDVVLDNGFEKDNHICYKKMINKTNHYIKILTNGGVQMYAYGVDVYRTLYDTGIMRNITAKQLQTLIDVVVANNL